jgi:hypothetical protein
MIHFRATLLPRILVILLAATASGCTLTFGLAGAAAKGERMTSDAMEFAEGTGVVLTTRTGERFGGLYLGLENRLDSEYYIRLASRQKRSEQAARTGSDAAWIVRKPQRGEIVRLVRTDSVSSREVRFHGFGGYGRLYMVVAEEGGVQQTIRIETIRSVEFENGTQASGADYQQMALRGELPSSTRVCLDTANGLLEIPAEQVASIRKAGARLHGVLGGALLGLIVDYLIFQQSMMSSGWNVD